MPPSTHTRQEQEKQIPQHPLLQGRAVCIETLLYGIAGCRSPICPETVPNMVFDFTENLKMLY